jgi:DNA-directed RNA polymerase specialized sigma24 family protein
LVPAAGSGVFSTCLLNTTTSRSSTRPATAAWSRWWPPSSATALSVALIRLPLAQRQVLVLYYLADLPVEQIARDCGISVGTVRNRLAAARDRLERELKEPDQEVPDARR